ncbi:MAG: sugar ABC transporter permease [Atribacterota bacterium]|nr:sugar ABC transporter permease [Atribacterota bacterium]MDD4896141.1 sugar ABC transporter permease [Atribacterota bacterium]MDD5637059.1 sugar ABC transporter permease [Atribacterota bacterium]
MINKTHNTINSLTVIPYIFVLPFIITFLLFFLYPIISAIIMSFQDIAGFRDVTFVGFKNYRNLLNPHYYNALRVSFTYTFLTIAILIPLPLVLAVLLNNKNLPGRNIFRSALFMPALTSVIVGGMFFRFAFGTQPTALFNHIIGWFGLEPAVWLQGKWTGMLAMVVLCVWRWTGVNIVYFLAGLQGIPNELYESADIDGANGLQKFFHITVPSLKPVIIFVTTISVFGGFSMFAESFAYWTSRSPGDIGLTLVAYIYQTGFNYNNFGFASAIGITLLAIIMTVNLIQLKIFGFFKEG